MTLFSRIGRLGVLWTSAAAVSVCLYAPVSAQDLPSPFVQVMAAEASANDAVAAFYKANGYQAIWMAKLMPHADQLC